MSLNLQRMPLPGGIDINTENGKKAADVWITWNVILVPISDTQAMTLAQLFTQLMQKKPTIWSWNEEENIKTLIKEGIINENSMMTIAPGFGENSGKLENIKSKFPGCF